MAFTRKTLTAITIHVSVALLATYAWADETQKTSQSPRPKVTGTKSPIPYVATRIDTVNAMLWLGEASSEDIVYDLGSGDGRICIAAVRDHGVRRAVGIEKDSELVAESRRNAEAAGVADRVTFVEGDLFETDISEATVVTLYLGSGPNIALRPTLLRMLQPGSFIVSHTFGMGEWPPDKKFYGRRTTFGMYGSYVNSWERHPFVPSYEGYQSDAFTADSVMAWRVPAPIAGVWKGTRETELGTLPVKVTFHQSLVAVEGSGNLFDDTDVSGRLTVDLWGSEIRMNQGMYSAAGAKFSPVLEGVIQGETIRGKSVRTVDSTQKTWTWTMTREPVDFTGNWVWEMEEAEGHVTLEILPNTEGHKVLLQWSGERYNITDFYDFGGGFYFTKLIQPENIPPGATLSTAAYLVGEAIVQSGELKGTIAFYPPGDYGDWGQTSFSKHNFAKFQEEWTAVRSSE